MSRLRKAFEEGNFDDKDYGNKKDNLIDEDSLVEDDKLDIEEDELDIEEGDLNLEEDIYNDRDNILEREKRKELKKKRRKEKRKRFFYILRKVILISFLLGVLITVIGGIYLYNTYMPVFNDLKASANEKILSINDGTFKDKVETIIYDRDGNVLDEVAINDYYYIKHEDIQQTIIDALISIEDVRYYEHNGYDLKAIARAAYHVIKNKGKAVQGGSTITQQLVKLQFLTLDKTYTRKLEEVMIAVALEDMYSKEQILEFYLNNINYGNGAYGIETASMRYFNKPSNELTLSEVAFLTAIPNNPSVYNPLRNFDNTMKRRDLILSKMLEYEKITLTEYNEAKNQEVILDFKERDNSVENYEVSFAISSATKELMELEGFEIRYNFSSEEEKNRYYEDYNDLFTQVSNKIRNGGYKIYTTIDSEKQKLLQQEIDDGLVSYSEIDKESGLYKTQGSAVTIDNMTGDVLAIVGGRSQEGVNNSYNRAYLSARQPGSAIKPLVAYTPMFERGLMTFDTVVDEEVEKGPRNVYNYYKGEVGVREAVEISINTIPFKFVKEDITPKKALDYLYKMNFSHISPSRDDHAGISVGGFTYGTNTLEMSGAFSTLARDGLFIKPNGIEKIVDVTNTVLYENERETTKVYTEESTSMMTDVLKGVIESPIGTARHFKLDNQIAAAKTGTTNDSKDSWFVGYTPYYTTAVWVGNDNPETIKMLRGYSSTGDIWKNFMDKIHEGLENKDFELAGRLRYMYVNPENGFVSEEEIDGWLLEIVTNDYFNRMSKEQEEYELEKQRLEEEEKKKEEEQKRKEEQEDISRQLKALGMLEEIENTHVTDGDSINVIYNYLNEVKVSIDSIRDVNIRNEYLGRFVKVKYRIEAEIKEIEDYLSKVREEQEQKEREQKEREEEERRKQEELERKEREEQERKEQEEQENEDNDNSDNEEPPVEDDPIEEEPVEDEPSEGEPDGGGNSGGDENIGNNS